MAVSRYIPKNIKKYKPKYFWGLNARQLVSLLIAGVLIAITIKLTGNLPGELRIYISVIPAIFPVAFGFVEIYGLPLEKFIPEVYHDYFVNTRKRYKITAPSLRLENPKKQPLKLNHKNKPLAVYKKK